MTKGTLNISGEQMARLSKVSLGLKRTAIREMNEFSKEFPNVLSFAQGEPDFNTPPHIVESAIEALRSGKTKYAPNAGIDELKKAISQKYLASHNLLYNWKTQVVITSCGMDNLRMASLAILDPDDEMIVPNPTWSNHPNHPFMASGKAIEVPVFEKDGFMYDIHELRKKISDRTKAILLNSPSNPTGGVISLKQLKELCNFAKENNLLIISDEVYEKIIFDDLPFYSPAMIDGMQDQVIICNSFSKTYAMTGWRLGYIVGPEDIIHGIEMINENSIASVNTFVQYAGVTALTATQDCVTQMVQLFQKRRDIVYEKINKIDGLSCLKPKGAFYAFINIRETGLKSKNFCTMLLKDQQVALVPGIGFGSGGEGFVRMSYAISEEKIHEGIDRIARFVSTIQ